jgi:uncharacterized protein
MRGMLIDEGLELLEESTCRSLLASRGVGRIGLTMGSVPVIFPVNHVVIDGAVVFRTAPGSKLEAAVRGSVVAFEVDDYEQAQRTGWSVLAVGKAEVVHDLDFTFQVIAAGLEPWAGGIRTHIVRIDPEFVSGRRLVRDVPAADGPSSRDRTLPLD